MNEQDLLEAIRQAHTFTNDDNALTASEIQEATGIGINQVRAKLKALISHGHVTVTWVYRDTLTTPLTGRMAKVPGYIVMGHGRPDRPGLNDIAEVHQ